MYKEIRAACGLNSNNLLAYWLDRLEADGRIRRKRRQPRNIEVTGVSLVQGGLWGEGSGAFSPSSHS
jgi:hypothetical protein